MKLDIGLSIRRYEDWLARELGDELVKRDLGRKHDAMRSGAFPFLRATFWRWAETVLELCPELADAPSVLAVGDIHLENFGTWRDADGRLIWGINDYDEAAEMPYALDLVRLATSALLARPEGECPPDAVAEGILAGYAAGLAAPAPVVLDHDHAWLRAHLVLDDAARAKFWAKMAPKPGKPPERWRRALLAALPPGAEAPRIWRRTAGTGSLGRPRWVALAEWRGGPVLREAKAVVTSGWNLPPQRGHRAIRCLEAATGRHRVPDPWYRVADHIAVRRLSPNNRKIAVADAPELVTSPRLLALMAGDLAAMHLGSGDALREIRRDLGRRKRRWLERAAARMAEAVRAEQRAYAKG
jgi:hypothetical protein